MPKRKDGTGSEGCAKLPSGFLSPREIQLVQNQIRNNSLAIDRYINTIDLLVNKERCPKDANTLIYLRHRLSIAISENDTFRRVLWRHTQFAEPLFPPDGTLDAASFLIAQIKSRRAALIAQLAMK